MEAKEQLTLYNIRSKDSLVQPFLKWAGGKRQLLPFIRKYLPKNFNIYFEPFLGAGAVLFDLQPEKAFINDLNEELINCYKVIKYFPDELLNSINKHINTEDYYYKIRQLDRIKNYFGLSDIEKASRIIYLNKTCYNGLFRVNSKGHFNTPFGNYKNPKIIQKSTIYAINRFLNINNIEILNVDFEEAVYNANKEDFIYFDPPYDPISITSSFTGYNLDRFNKNEQTRLQKVIKKLTWKGCKIMLSNSSTDFIKNLYNDFNIISVPANRSINSNGEGRGKIEEYLIINYDPDK
ncbi:MAG: DNA adenine methylase [Bacteroidales bacterium]|nr:DNA adenine methylase [Bacteroidales bacterium]